MPCQTRGVKENRHSETGLQRPALPDPRLGMGAHLIRELPGAGTPGYRTLALAFLTSVVDERTFFCGHAFVPPQADPPTTGKPCRSARVGAHAERSLSRDFLEQQVLP